MSINNIIVKTIKNRNISINNIVEIGSRDGKDCDYISKELGVTENNIYVFEPNIYQYKKIVSMYPKFNNYNYCLSETNGKRKFICIKDKVGISSLLNRIDGVEYECDVTMVTSITGEYLQNNIIRYIDLCKVDVEGYGVNVLESFSSLKYINVIVIELEHKTIWENQKLYSDAEKILSLSHNQVWTSYRNGDRQSDSIWIRK